jgi:hypothetical protein
MNNDQGPMAKSARTWLEQSSWRRAPWLLLLPRLGSGGRRRRAGGRWTALEGTQLVDECADIDALVCQNRRVGVQVLNERIGRGSAWWGFHNSRSLLFISGSGQSVECARVFLHPSFGTCWTRMGRHSCHSSASGWNGFSWVKGSMTAHRTLKQVVRVSARSAQTCK